MRQPTYAALAPVLMSRIFRGHVVQECQEYVRIAVVEDDGAEFSGVRADRSDHVAPQVLAPVWSRLTERTPLNVRAVGFEAND